MKQFRELSESSLLALGQHIKCALSKSKVVFVKVKEEDLDEGVDGRLLYNNDETGGRS